MAKKKAAAAQLPEGYEELGSALVGFFERKPGNTVQGIYRGHYDSRGKFGEKRTFRIELTDGKTEITTKDGDDLAEVGDVIGVNETGYLKRLGDLKEGRRVFVRCISKGPNEKDPWVFQVAAAN